MKRISIIGTAALFLVVGAVAPAYAQKDDHKDGGKPSQGQQGKPEQQHAQKAAPARQQHEQQAQQSRPAQQQHSQQTEQSRPAQQHAEQSRPAQQQRAHQTQPAQQQHTQQAQQSRPAQQQHAEQATRSAQQRNPAQARQEQAAWSGDRAKNWKSDHRTWQQRGGYNGYRVPDSSFRTYYGDSHYFRIDSLPVVFVGGQQRFQYGGFWFGLVDPWPEYWATNWYDDDDVYVDYYNGGYYMTNRRYPSDRIAISFYLN